MITEINVLNAMLDKLNQEGGFSYCILTDALGFLLASSANDKDQITEYQTASMALLQKTIKQANTNLGLGLTEEYSLSTPNGHSLVCRPFLSEGYELILAIILASRRQSYRRITKRTINEIQKTLRTCCS